MSLVDSGLPRRSLGGGGRALPALLLSAAVLAPPLGGLPADLVRAVRAVPPHVAGRFRNPAGFQQSASGQYFVFDRRSHVVFGVDEQWESSWPIVHIGAEEGRIIDPTAFSVEPGGTFVVADAPHNQERIQIFSPAGFRIGGFMLPGRATTRVMFENIVVSGIGTLQYTGTSILMSQPETGALFAEYKLSGTVKRLIGNLRKTGHEADHDVHLALNSGIPLIDPTGGFFFVFQTGEPLMRKYDAEGHLVFERLIQGREIDEVIGQVPTTWPLRKTEDGVLPLVTPTIRSAAVDSNGNLWIAFVVPYTYVLNPDGDKIRTLQFRGAGLVSPNSMFFGRMGQLLVTPGLYEFAP